MSTSPLVLVFGAATPLVEAEVASIRATVEPHVGPAAFNVSRYRAGDDNALDAFQAARTLPMMADRRLVLVSHMEEGGNRFYEALQHYLEKPCAETTFLLTGSRFPKRSKGTKAWGAPIKKAWKAAGGTLKELGERSTTPARFAVERAKASGKKLGRSEAKLLVELVGADLATLASEVDKIAIFAGDSPTIEAQHIQGAGSALSVAAIWDLTGAIAARAPSPALEATQRLLDGGDDPRRLLAMILWQLREMLTASDVIAAGGTDSAVSAVSKIRSGALRGLRKRIKADGPLDAAHLLCSVARAHRAMNSHRAGARRIFENLVLEMVA